MHVRRRATSAFHANEVATNQPVWRRAVPGPTSLCSRVRTVADAVEQHRLLIAERALLEGTLLGAVQALMDASRW